MRTENHQVVRHTTETDSTGAPGSVFESLDEAVAREIVAGAIDSYLPVRYNTVIQMDTQPA